MYTAVSPIPLSAAAGESTQSVCYSFLRSYAGVCLEGTIIILSCIIFTKFAGSPPVIDPEASAVSMVWSLSLIHIQSGKELKVFAIRHKDLKTFCEEAKRYGVLYSVLKEKNNTDGICDIMVRAEDAAKISRIVDKYELATIDTNAIRNSILNERQNPLKDVPILNDKEHDDLVHKLMASTKNKEQKNSKENSDINPKKAWTCLLYTSRCV